MTWVAVGVGVATAAVSYSQSASAAAGASNTQSKGVIRHNGKIVAANVENTIRTGFRVGLLNLQQGQAKKAFVQQGFEVGAAAQQVLSATTANAAAAGQIGASVEAVEADVYQKLGEAQAQQKDAWELTQLNFNNELEGLVKSGQDSLSGADGEIAKVESSLGGMLTAGVMGGANQFASTYLAKKMDLGLGAQPAGTNLPSTVSLRGMNTSLGSGTSFLSRPLF